MAVQCQDRQTGVRATALQFYANCSEVTTFLQTVQGQWAITLTIEGWEDQPMTLSPNDWMVSEAGVAQPYVMTDTAFRARWLVLG